MMQIPLKNPSILVIDDEPGIREGLKRLFLMEHIKIETCASYAEAMEEIDRKEYDLYLIDLKLPDGDGLYILKKIKEKDPEAVCIIMTAYGSISSAVEAVKVGAFSYITKPFLPDDFIVVCTQALEHRWYILEARRLKREHHRRLLEVAYEQTRLKTIIQSLKDGVLILNKDQELVLYNQPLIRLLEIKKPLMIGESVADVIPMSIQKQIEQMIRERQSVRNLEEEYVVIPPIEKVVLAQTSAIFDETEEFLGTVTIIRDITELKKIEQVKNQFVNMVAHELKAPIAAIVGYLDMISNRTLGNELKNYDKYIDRSIARALALQQLVNDLLELSRMRAGTVRREIKEINLSEILKETIEFFESEAVKKHISIRMEIEDHVIYRADAEEMRRLFSNFLSNGIKYNVENGSVRIFLKKERTHLRIEFEDTGIGMTEEEQKNVFKEFFRAKNKYTAHIPGTGLGASIAKKIIDQYNGKIDVRSTPGKGTCFTISFPL
jgi:PAS domain S-box-containing protein